MVFDEGSASGPSHVKFDETDPNAEETQPLAIGRPPKAIENANDSPGDNGETTIDDGSSDEESINEEPSEEVNNDKNALIHAPNQSDHEKLPSARELSCSNVEGQVSIEWQVSRGQGHRNQPGCTSDGCTGHAVAPLSLYPVPIPTPAIRQSSHAQKTPIRDNDSRFFINAYVRPTLQENEPKDNRTDDLPGLLEVHGDADEEDACCAATATPLDSEPLTYSNTIEHPDADLWQAAMASELKTFEEIGLYQEVEAPPNHKIIDSKWVFKIKHSPNGEIDKYKACLIAKGYTQVEGLDYTDTFAPVTKFTTIRSLLALAAQHDLEVHQIDVKAAFLNISKPPLGCAELYRYAYHHRPHSKVPTNKETHRGVQYCTPTSG